MQRFGNRRATEQPQGPTTASEPDLHAPGTPQDVASPRAKNARHKKVTADKWNQ